ncbi:MAG: FeoB-associated Cys-rich membrane protein [Atopobiaceae bacterium]|jgi:hypothetical protein
MSGIDIVILVMVIAVLAICIRSFTKGGSECADCASSGSCSAYSRAQGKCIAAEDMLKRASEALDTKGDLTHSA